MRVPYFFRLKFKSTLGYIPEYSTDMTVLPGSTTLDNSMFWKRFLFYLNFFHVAAGSHEQNVSDTIRTAVDFQISSVLPSTPKGFTFFNVAAKDRCSALERILGVFVIAVAIDLRSATFTCALESALRTNMFECDVCYENCPDRYAPTLCATCAGHASEECMLLSLKLDIPNRRYPLECPICTNELDYWECVNVIVRTHSDTASLLTNLGLERTRSCTQVLLKCTLQHPVRLHR